MTSPPVLPDDVALLWGRRGAGRRGRRPALTVADLTRAAVAVADAEGLAAVSMARVAAELGNATMALYRHVRSKEELLLLMADAAVEEPPPGLGEGDWRQQLTAWAAAVLAVLRRHPWFRDIPISGPPMGPGNLAWLDRGLAALEGSPLDDGERLAVITGLITLVHGEARLAIDLERGFAADPEAAGRGYGATLGSLLDPARFPALARAVASGVFDAPPPADAASLGGELEEAFRFALDRYLDGVAAYVARRGSRSTGRPPS
ncbi:TetR/AcrR family transcriptional regulator [Geodermatophilus sp. CPCC 206100]|uniref:TetR/AcrR family transcriptional regulator n=1 Tax=Geodermatophilus sp. CPCC 206100 TaxID=3020054 RepID=UPI003B00164C